MIRLATRGSALALVQARWVKSQLEALGKQVELVLIETQGDRELQAFSTMQGSGFFTKAVQEALLKGSADLAVHSYKDLPSAPTPGLEIAAVPRRADPREVLLVHPDYLSAIGFQSSELVSGLPAVGLRLADDLPLKPSAIVGTSAVRRQAQLQALIPDLVVRDLRGNVETRIHKLRCGDYDAIVLAAAGLERLALNLDDLGIFVLEPELLIPAPAQGALALEIRREDEDLASLLTALHDARGFPVIAAERGLMAMLQAGCQLDLGAYARSLQNSLEMLVWFQGKHVRVSHKSAEGLAYFARVKLEEQ